MMRQQDVSDRGAVFSRVLMRAASIAPASKKVMWRWVYESLSRRGGLGDFMNFGYMQGPDDPMDIELEGDDIARRFVIQMYHRTIAAAKPEGKDVLEVGCGRGGGASFVTRYMRPRSYTGVDIAPGNVEFCRVTQRHVPGLSFHVGDAERLPFGAATFDVVLNVESSHCYPSFENFVGEVHRVLRPGGSFMFTDMRGDRSHQASLEDMVAAFDRSPLEVVENTDITPNVLEALDHEGDRLDAYLQTLPTLLRDSTRDLIGGRGGRWYEALRNGTAKYVRYHLRKPA